MRTSHRYALTGLAALTLLAAGCGSSSSGSSSGGTNWSTVTSAAAGGGMSKLIAAAKKEGTLNVIALPADWANYGTIIKDFSAEYGIKVNSIAPDDSSAQEVTQIQQKNGTSLAALVKSPVKWASNAFANCAAISRRPRQCLDTLTCTSRSFTPIMLLRL